MQKLFWRTSWMNAWCAVPLHSYYKELESRIDLNSSFTTYTDAMGWTTTLCDVLLFASGLEVLALLLKHQQAFCLHQDGLPWRRITAPPWKIDEELPDMKDAAEMDEKYSLHPVAMSGWGSHFQTYKCLMEVNGMRGQRDNRYFCQNDLQGNGYFCNKK